MLSLIVAKDAHQRQAIEMYVVICFRLPILENILLAPLTTFKVGGKAQFFCEATSEFEVTAAVDHARKHALRLFVMGGGSNLVVSDAGWRGLVLKIGIRGIEHQGDVFHVGAGEDWDAFVAHAVAKGYAGVECMSGIPGTVGGTPVQNVGAYGQEVRDTIVSVRVLDTTTGEPLDLSNEECHFAYRKSRFNTEEPGRFIVLRVSYRLKAGGAPTLQYLDLKRYFSERSATPDLQMTRDAVRDIRKSKGMLIVEGDPDCQSAGSFFKNPQVSKEHHAVLLVRTEGRQPPMPHWAGNDGRVKLSAAWLIEQAGFPRGYTRGQAGISSKHTLAIINRGGARASEIIALKDEIQMRVRELFGVDLVAEPVLLGF